MLADLILTITDLPIALHNQIIFLFSTIAIRKRSSTIPLGSVMWEPLTVRTTSSLVSRRNLWT